ncbi:MAG: CHAP domain-containing protein [Bacteroidia bacterium]|nr:CHAP domain-containing protein [Bacteroidia bacterium]
MKKRIHIKIALGTILLLLGTIWALKNLNLNPLMTVGQPIDTFNGVNVFYNGGVGHVSGRNTTDDGYNLGLKYQCVEFVKRYYYEYLNHKMPDSYGHAKDFFDESLESGQLNSQRDLIQFANLGHEKPKIHDLIVFKGHLFNRFGHVAIVSAVSEDSIEIVQQNPGPFGKSRKSILMVQVDGKWEVKNNGVLGWLRKE